MVRSESDHTVPSSAVGTTGADMDTTTAAEVRARTMEARLALGLITLANYTTDIRRYNGAIEAPNPDPTGDAAPFKLRENAAIVARAPSACEIG